MKENKNLSEEFYICEEDNIFDELSSLYEDIPANPYFEASVIDLNYGYQFTEEECKELEALIKEDSLEEAFADLGPDKELQPGDIVIAWVYQDKYEAKNVAHCCRPFLITHANVDRFYGFQLTTSKPDSLHKFLVKLQNPELAGLNTSQSYFIVDTVRGISYSMIKGYVGHITVKHKLRLLDKLKDIKENKDDEYPQAPIFDKIDHTIQRVKHISINETKNIG